MKQTTRIICITLCVLLIALSAAGVIWVLYNKFASNKAYADYLDIQDQNTLVNFNQYIPNNYINYTTSETYSYLTISNVNFNIGDKIYIRIDNDSSSTILITFNNIEIIRSSSNQDFIYTCNTNFTTINVYQNGMKYKNFNVINLTQFFGSGNDNLTLEQAQEYFAADYYGYSSGTPISYYGVDNYNAAFQDLFAAYQYKLELNALTTTTFAYNLNNNSSTFDYNTTSGGYWYMQNCIGIPLFTTLNAGAQITIKRQFYAPNVADNYYTVCYGYLDEQANMVELFSTPITTDMQSNTFGLNSNINTLYIYFRITSTKQIDYTANFIIYGLEVSATQLDVNSMVINANNSGQEVGYRTGYQAGYNKGIADQSATLGTMEYVGAAFSGIGSILQIELLPGIPFSLFILLPLMFGLITFVVKMVKGGGD